MYNLGNGGGPCLLSVRVSRQLDFARVNSHETEKVAKNFVVLRASLRCVVATIVNCASVTTVHFYASRELQYFANFIRYLACV